MVIANFLIGLPVMALCLVVQVAVAFWSVRYAVREFAEVPAPRGYLAKIRPLVVAMLVMVMIVMVISFVTIDSRP